ncbi:hypothetical protein ZIOFF_044992 [Zingiber officinale]|uniref:Sodium/calcium exchanger membrane region domain-containing protein n=1 Tax=Zingiber officinale TaxID=94328 RepID=A0A8J5G730_ZINOF|nr:hypothetical protein ZIOFF_044992 [Zingiber officinale]
MGRNNDRDGARRWRLAADVETRRSDKDDLVAAAETIKMRPVDEREGFAMEVETIVNSSLPSTKIIASEILHSRPLSNVAYLRTFWRILIGLSKSIKVVIFSAKINILLPFGPLSIILHFLTKNHGLVFFFSLIGIIPLAERLGYATEQLAAYTGNTVGGLLNATFGNATEMIIAIYALKSGMIRVVQQSLLGSILSNMLLVLGCAFFAGGIIHNKKDQIFDKAAAVVNSGLLLMAVMGLTFPAVLHFTRSEVHYGKSEVALSRFSSGVMLVAYASYLFFQLRSQQDSYHPIADVFELTLKMGDIRQGDDSITKYFNSLKRLWQDLVLFSTYEWKFADDCNHHKKTMEDGCIYKFLVGLNVEFDEEEGHSEDSDEEEPPELSQWEAISWLAVLTLWISILSEYLVDAIEGASDALNLPLAFISVILLPIVGNAAEHASAIMFAMKDKLDISIGVAIGSSTQISMFVIPFTVVVGWLMEKQMDLNFQLFETATLFITVLVVAFMLQEGTANYFKGLMLILCYFIVAASFFFHTDPVDSE